MDPTKTPAPTVVNEGTASTDDPAPQVPPIKYVQTGKGRPTRVNPPSAQEAGLKASILQEATDATAEDDPASRDDASCDFDSSENEDLDCTTCENGQHGTLHRMSIEAAVKAWKATSFSKGGSATGCPGPQTTEETGARAETATFGVEGLLPFEPPAVDWFSEEGTSSFEDGAAKLFVLDMGQGK
jgi:hypothetical protein